MKIRFCYCIFLEDTNTYRKYLATLIKKGNVNDISLFTNNFNGQHTSGTIPNV